MIVHRCNIGVCRLFIASRVERKIIVILRLGQQGRSFIRMNGINVSVAHEYRKAGESDDE